jgi:hypothetical protein
MRPLIVLIVAGLVAQAGLAGCGSDDATTSAPPPPAAVTSTEASTPANVVKQTDLQGIPLGLSQAAILKRFGPPAARPSSAKQRCLVYATDGGPDTWQRFCFIHGKLANIATVIGRRNAVTLDTPAIKGPGKLEQPKVGPAK